MASRAPVEIPISKKRAASLKERTSRAPGGDEGVAGAQVRVAGLGVVGGDAFGIVPAGGLERAGKLAMASHAGAVVEVEHHGANAVVVDLDLSRFRSVRDRSRRLRRGRRAPTARPRTRTPTVSRRVRTAARRRPPAPGRGALPLSASPRANALRR